MCAWPQWLRVRAGQSRRGETEEPRRLLAESIAAGQQLYATLRVVPRHATARAGPGNDLIPAAPSLTDDKWDHGSTDGEIFDNIKNGVAPDFNMVPFKDQLKDDEIWNVVNYMRSIAKK